MMLLRNLGMWIRQFSTWHTKAKRTLADHSRRPIVEVLEDRTVPSVTIGQNFTGSTYLIQTGSIRPDTDGAVGLNHFVELINGRFRVYNKVGGAEVQSKTLDQFWLDAGVGAAAVSNTFDPRVVFDHASGRWFASSASNGQSAASNYLVAVSASSDPTLAWTGFTIDADAANTTWLDFPTLGLDADGVYLSGVMFTIAANAFDHDSIVSIPKADLLAGVPTIANRTVFANENPSTRGSTLQPAVDYGASDGRGAILARDNDVFSVLNRTSVLNAGGAGASLSTSSNINVPTTSAPPTAVQPAGVQDVDAGDDRFSSTVFEVGNSLWAVQSITSTNRAAIRWYEINETTNAVIQSGTIADASADYYYPSIAANAFGEVVIGFSRSNATAGSGFVSSYAATGTTASGVTTFGSPILLKQGTATYLNLDGTRNRWGDYSATTLDPSNPHHFWTIQEWVSAANTWSTQVTELAFFNTSVNLDGSGNLVITDTATGGKNDTLTISISGANVRVLDPNQSLLAQGGAIQVNATTVDVPQASITGTQGIVVNTLDGNDRLVLDYAHLNPVPGNRLTYNGGAGVDTLVRTIGDNTWNLTAANAGNITGLVASFLNIENLTGGAGRDVFHFGTGGSSTGIIDGGAGTNWLDYGAVAGSVVVNLTTGVAPRVGSFTKVNNVIGSATGGDKLTGNSSGGVLLAHFGGNVITAGAGRSVLIGGYGLNTLSGGAADDLLINGRTTYDSDVGVLGDILGIWQGPLAYKPRTDALKAIGPNQLKINTTVFIHPGQTAFGAGPRFGRGNFVYQSNLLGNGGSDWFITNYLATVLDRKPGEIVTTA